LPRTLSGGERQRTAVGRAIIREPAVFLFDEPLSNLDFQLRNQMRAELKSLQQRLGKTSIYVTHDQTEAMTMADHLVVLNKGQVVQSGPPEEVFQYPANLFVARFIGSPPMNILEVKTAGGDVGVKGSNSPLTSLKVPDGLYQLGIRPDQLLATQIAGPCSMIVKQTEFHGTATYLIGEVGNTSLMALNTSYPAASVGDRVYLDISPRICHLFDPVTGFRVDTTSLS
jgi:ABC-type sugar transport system ATPase subunit